MAVFEEQILKLYTTDQMPTENPKNAYRVVSGSVFVYIAPVEAGGYGKRVYLTTCETGSVIPSFAFRDEQYRNWTFLLTAREDAVLAVMEGMVSRVLCRNFAKMSQLPDYEVEGFENALVQFYEKENLKDQVILKRTGRDDNRVQDKVLGVIKDAFVAGEKVTGKDPLYRSMAFACSAAGIPLLSPDEIFLRCGSNADVTQIASVSRFICRKVVLDADWYKHDCGTLICELDGAPVACVPRGQSGYTLYYGDEDRKEKLSAEKAKTISPEAYSIARALPNRTLTKKDLFSFGFRSLRKADIAMVLILGLVGTLIGILLPSLNQMIYDKYIPLGDRGLLVQICFVIATFMIANLFFDMVKGLTEFRISSHAAYGLQNAVYYRIFHLPESFFRSYDSADLAQRLGNVSGFANTFINSIVLAGFSSLFSLMYLFKMFKYSGKLTGLALLMLVIYGALLFFIATRTMKFDRKTEELRGTASSKLYQFLNGIEKIRMSGSEDRAAYEYMVPYAGIEHEDLRKIRVSAINTVLSGSISTIFSLFFYILIVKKNISVSTGAFVAFNSAFGAFSGAVLQLVGGALSVYSLRPQYDRFRPVMETAPEDDENKELPGEMEGRVTVENVHFAYEAGAAPVLNGISMDIKPGEYVGIVGSSGCGKSTLLKLLLGFEQPGSGQICYDSKDLKTLDKRALRKKLGVVLQNGRLISGSIYENITITAPGAKLEDVNRVIEAVGLKPDIERMPMGIHTVLSESSGTISGGQQQRILIARAIISNPKVLIFDEATSALDNLTQAQVCASLDKMHSTRIVVAHRLSTIQNCDRIFVLDKGRVVEEGSFDELLNIPNGLFRELARRQMAE